MYILQFEYKTIQFNLKLNQIENKLEMKGTIYAIIFFIVTLMINALLIISSALKMSKYQSIIIGCYGIYSICYTLFNVVISTDIINNLSRKFIAVIISINIMTIIPFTLMMIVFDYYPFDYSNAIYIINSLFLGYDIIITMIPSLISVLFVIYYSLCYLVFMNKTYRSPPTEQTQTPLITQSLPKDITGAGIMYFSQAPGSTNHFRRRSISTDVIELKEKNIAAIAVCLTHNDLNRLQLDTYRETMEENNIQFIHCPIVDFWFPSDMELFNQQVENVYSYIQSGQNILVHCNSGKGRTGLFGASVFSKLCPGKPAHWYIKTIRKYLPGAFDTVFQRFYFKMYLDHFSQM